MAVKVQVQDQQVTISVVRDIEKTRPYLQEKSTTQNGIVVPDAGYDGLSQVNVDVQLDAVMQIKKVTENGLVFPDEGYDGLRRVEVDVYTPPVLQEKEVTENGEVLPDEGYDGLSKVIVNIETGSDSGDGSGDGTGDSSGSEPMLQDATFTENGTYYPDEGYDGFSSVTVEVETYEDGNEVLY